MTHARIRLRCGLGEDLRGLALVSLGITGVWAAQFDWAEPHLEQGIALARRIGRPYLEFTALAYQAVAEFYRSFPRTAERSRQAIELAREHGWTDEPGAGIAYMRLGSVLAWQGRPEEAEPAPPPAGPRPPLEPLSDSEIRVLRYLPRQYEIGVRGHLGETMCFAFPALRAQACGCASRSGMRLAANPPVRTKRAHTARYEA